MENRKRCKCGGRVEKIPTGAEDFWRRKVWIVESKLQKKIIELENTSEYFCLLELVAGSLGMTILFLLPLIILTPIPVWGLLVLIMAWVPVSLGVFIGIGWGRGQRLLVALVGVFLFIDGNYQLYCVGGENALGSLWGIILVVAVLFFGVGLWQAILN